MEMLEHIQKEERVLFPFIAQMDQDSVVTYPSAHACFRSVSFPIFMMEQEHESANHIMEELRNLTRGFEPPEWGCITHIALFAGIREFEADLKQHVHLENDVLFPRAIQMEAELNRKG
jgi:regulator of cell morphogenesis and NO signaling